MSLLDDTKLAWFGIWGLQSTQNDKPLESSLSRNDVERVDNGLLELGNLSE
jgi:hypothetical protein